ncbi:MULTISPECIES: hypothetical protein [unclassified Pseudomonas]|uniref:hypothetical protein n=1 Tax=unclassified Pseudomonas TaxID=196821 RepID=UPI0011EDAC1A|nr:MULTISPECIES: hypothetical protein [unclassified Pseudomonas]KAA0945554.1 hypothetical protein FQ182_16835 [Pseudomonas sp. ANT_H4]KAA0951839.1 hypothetical protein FQ186_14415 [Pseudomonas sp. ANT_H14]
MAVMKILGFAFNDDVQHNILAYQAVSSEQGSPGLPGQGALDLYFYKAGTLFSFPATYVSLICMALARLLYEVIWKVRNPCGNW